MAESLYPALSPGTQIASYRIESLLGRGGMAMVFQARDLRLDRPVGLKVLPPELAESPQFRERFLRESRLAASLDHPNIIPVYEAGEDHGLLFIAMRLVGGGNLAARLEQRGRLGPADTVGLLSQVAAALDAAHAAGLVHRDVKPGNILVVPGVAGHHRDHVYLSDFGLTKRVTSLSGVTAQGQFIATMDYAAPEQIGGRPVDARTDVYGLGCVVYQCLTGSVPFVRDNEAALLWAHLVERPPPLSAYHSGLAPFNHAVARALAKNPEDRFDSCGQFVDALAAAFPAPGTPATTDHTPPPPIRDATTSPRLATAEPPAVIIPADTPLAEQPMPGSDEGVPNPAAAPVGGPPWPSRRRVSRWAVLIAILIAVAVPAFVIVQAVTGSGPGTANVAAATRQCQSALAAADQTLPDGQEVAHQLRVHAGFMNQMQPANGYAPQVRYLGRPSLTAGALAAGKYEDKLAGYKTLSTGCLSSVTSPQPCKARVAAADQAFGHVSNVVTALQQHTAIMDQWDSGQLTADQAHDLGQPSLNTGLAEANALDQSARTYQTAGTC
ncbi:MAG: protein kinase domain-containing protein [Frankiaceae bacterium]